MDGPPGEAVSDEGARDRVEVEFWRLAQELLKLGQSVILESGFWIRADRDEKRLGAQALGALVELHFLAVPLEELWRRLELRNQRARWSTVLIRRARLGDWVTFFEPPDQAELELFGPVE